MINLLITSINAALEASKEINIIYNDPKSDFGIERKNDNSPLTKADKKSNEVIMKYLLPTGIPVLSEEGRSVSFTERKDWNRLWIVDPLDGTKEFIKKNGEFTVNIALVENGVPLLGVIYLPVKQILYFGAKDLGSFKITIPDDQAASFDELMTEAVKLPVAKTDSMYRSVASRSQWGDGTKDFISELEKEHGNIELVSSGSSIKICMVAEGSADIYPRFEIGRASCRERVSSPV